MFQKQNTHKNSFSCEPCEGSCEPFYKIIHTVKAFNTNTYSYHVNHVNDFIARAREGKNHILIYIIYFLINFDHKTINIKNSPRARKSHKSFTSFTYILNICFTYLFYVNDCQKSFTRSLTSFTWK